MTSYWRISWRVFLSTEPEDAARGHEFKLLTPAPDEIPSRAVYRHLAPADKASILAPVELGAIESTSPVTTSRRYPEHRRAIGGSNLFLNYAVWESMAQFRAAFTGFQMTT
jgi:hypothetical protein